MPDILMHFPLLQTLSHTQTHLAFGSLIVSFATITSTDETRPERPLKTIRAMGHWPAIFKNRRSRLLIIAALLTAIVAVIDLWMPRTAAPAIFYSGILALVASSGSRERIVPAALLFAALTWVGGVFEPPGGALWISIADRSIVTGVLWLTAVLMLRRERDLVALHELSQELARRNNELDQVASVVAHDIRSPLATASLFAELMARPASRDEEESNRAVIVNSLHEMDQLIRDLLEATRRPQPQSDCDSQLVLERVLRTMEGEFRQSGARVTFDPLPQVHADEAQLRQIFQNLIQNSIKYRSDAPLAIHVSATRKDQAWEFRVRDNGIGVPPDQAQRIFQRFGPSADARGRSSGVGLGLSVCKRIIEQHGGRIWVEPTTSAGNGTGASFCFTLWAKGVQPPIPTPPPQ
jgi:signal transduction histidine kinase